MQNKYYTEGTMHRIKHLKDDRVKFRFIPCGMEFYCDTYGQKHTNLSVIGTGVWEVIHSDTLTLQVLPGRSQLNLIIIINSRNVSKGKRPRRVY